jgi:hypothetical protein
MSCTVYTKLNFSVVLYGWDLISYAKRSWIEGVWESLLRRIFRPSMEEVTGGWRKLLNEELRYLYTSPNITWMKRSGRIRWMGRVWQGNGEKCLQCFCGKTRKDVISWKILLSKYKYPVWEQDAEENIFTQEGWNDRMLEKTAKLGAS